MSSQRCQIYSINKTHKHFHLYKHKCDRRKYYLPNNTRADKHQTQSDLMKFIIDKTNASRVELGTIKETVLSPTRNKLFTCKLCNWHEMTSRLWQTRSLTFLYPSWIALIKKYRDMFEQIEFSVDVIKLFLPCSVKSFFFLNTHKMWVEYL